MGKTFSTGLLTNGIWQDASNNIGIGGSPSGSYKLEVTGTAKVSSTLLVSSTVTAVGLSKFWDGTQGFNIGAATFGTGYGAIYSTGVTPSSTNFSFTSNGLSSYVNATNDAGITINNGSKGIFLISSGNVGIGTSSPSDKLQVSGVIRASNTTDPSYYGTLSNPDGLTHLGTFGGGSLVFDVSGTERMRIDTNGRVSITGTTYPLNVYNSVNASGTGVMVTTLGSNANNTSSYHYIATTGVADKFYVFGNGTYQTVSDIRLKKNITKVTDTYLDKVLGLNIVKYNWNDQEDGTPLEFGMIAQEVEELIPSIVHDGRLNEDGNSYKGIQASVLPYILIKAIQEMNQQNQDLKSRLDKAGL